MKSTRPISTTICYICICCFNTGYFCNLGLNVVIYIMWLFKIPSCTVTNNFTETHNLVPEYSCRDVLPSKQLSTRDARGIRGIFRLSTGQRPSTSDTRHCATSRATPAFIPPDLWPANSSDLNPVDYRIWSVQQRVHQSRVHDTDELKQCVQQVWRNVDQSIIGNAIERIRACVQANGGHFEQML